MGYGDLHIYDIVIFAAIAIFLVFRLRNVLGKKTGLNRQSKKKNDQANNLIKEKIKNKTAPELDENFIELKKAYGTLDDFNHNNFIDGAKKAFETIINAFNQGDKKTLQTLLTKDVYKTFEKAINENKIDSENQIFSLNISGVENVLINNGKIIIKIKFISEHIKNDDENTIVKKEDIWSFEKPLKSNNPNWLLCST